MAGRRWLDSGPPQPGHHFQHIQVNEDANAHLGDTYHISRENPLSLLPFATDALFNSYVRQHEPICLPDTRVDVLQKISQWADSDNQQCIFWLSGMAGTGKSTIAHTIARAYFEQGRLAASFFFSRGGGDAGNASKFVTTIAMQLAVHIPLVQPYICDAITERPIIANLSLMDQWRLLVLQPLSKVGGEAIYSIFVVAIDALDECDSEDDIRIILRLLAEARSMKVRLRVLVTSRPEVPIRHGFSRIADVEYRDFILHDIEGAIVDHDISIFLDYEMRLIGQERGLGAGWPGELAIRTLVRKASGLFIWAATACRFIREGEQLAQIRLSTLLQGNQSVRGPEKRLNEIYFTVLKNSLPTDCTEQEQDDLYDTLKKILGSIVTLFSPLSANCLAMLLHMPKDQVDQTFHDLHAILDIPEDQTSPLRLHHPSFRDFLLDQHRCCEPKFRVNEKQAHQTLADNCIRLMSNCLKKDVCGQEAPGILVANVESSLIEQYLPPEVRYASLHWIQHLYKSDAQLLDNGQVHQFLQVHFLHWLEALGWMGKTSEGIRAILSLETQILASQNPSLYTFVHDAKRFVQYNRSVIEQAPLQLYCSSLVFAPEKSIIRRQFNKYIPAWIRTKPRVQEDWSAALQRLESHSDWVNAVAFSPDGKTLASASDERTIMLWDADLGTLRQTLKGHSGKVTAVAFSPDSKTLASASYDCTIKLWDTSLGVLQQTLKDHSAQVTAVAFSPDGKILASASADDTVKLWDAGSDALRQTVECHGRAVYSIAFSPDGKTLASALEDCTVKLWDAGSGALRQTLKGRSNYNYATAITFSPDGKILASASSNYTVMLWDVGSGALQQTLEGHSGKVTTVAFSPDGKMLASASDDRTVILWDASSDAPQTTKGHSDWVHAMAFSPDGKMLAAASGDRAVKLWDASSGVLRQTLEDHSSLVMAVAFSPDSKTLASASADNTVKLWDASLGELQQTFKGHSAVVNSVAFSPDGKILASASSNRTIKLWDASLGALRQTFQGHSDWINALAFSPDGKMLASAADSTVMLWDTSCGTVLQTLKAESVIQKLSFSDDGAALRASGGLLETVFVSGSKILSPVSPSPSVIVREHWVGWGQENILWLPFEYRPMVIATHGSIVGFGYSSGRVLVMEFAF